MSIEGTESVSVSTADAVNAVIDAATGVESEGTEVQAVEGQEQATETTETTEAPKPEESPDQKFAAKFAALNRREQAIKAQQKEMKAMRQQLEAQQKELAEKMTRIETDVRGKYVDPEVLKSPAKAWETLKNAGVTLESLAEVVMNDGKETPERLVKKTEDTLRAELEEVKKMLQEREQKEQSERESQAIEQFRSKLKADIDSTEDYELIRANDAYDAVYEVINTNYAQQVEAFEEEHGREPSVEERQSMILSNKEASDMVEKYLLDEAKKFTSLKKIKGLMAPAPAKPAPTEAKQQQKTLTNTLSTTVPKTGSRKLTDEESLAEAAKLIKWEE